MLNCGSVCDYEKREECGSLTTRALRTVPSQAVKHIVVLLLVHTDTHTWLHTITETGCPAGFKLNSCRGVKPDKS